MSPTPWRIKADYLENCNCDLLCPCLFAVAPTESDCNVPIAYHIREGHYGTVQLDDLTVVRVTIFPGPGLMSSGGRGARQEPQVRRVERDGRTVLARGSSSRCRTTLA